MQKRHERKQKARSKIPRDFLAPCDPKEFLFCFSLWDAAGSGRMATRNPTNLHVNITNYGEVRLTDSPLNRAILAVRDHFDQTRGRGHTQGREFKILCNRLWTFSEIISQFLQEEADRRFAKYILQGEDETSIDEVLIEAAATAKMKGEGYDLDSLFNIADRLKSEENSRPGSA